ncbi:MAG: hypothetical protein RCG15_00385 [Candidatus Rickettsia vulgarisii]
MKNKDFNEDNSQKLITEILKGHYEEAKDLIKNGHANANYVSPYGGWAKKTPLLTATS